LDQRPVIVSWGEVLWDRFPHGDELGGAPANVAFHLAERGANAWLVSRVGDDDDGRRAVSALASAGVHVEGVQLDPDLRTGEVGVDIDDDGNARYTLYNGRAWERIECGEDELRLLATADVFCFGTLAQRTAEGYAAHRSALEALPAKAIVVCDPNLRTGFGNWDLMIESLGSAGAVKINEAEARAVERHVRCDDAADHLHSELGVELVALTCGERGCLLTTASGHRAEHAGFQAEPGGDNVGCGDAFTATLCLGLANGWSLERIAETANRAASIVAGHPGATRR